MKLSEFDGVQINGTCIKSIRYANDTAVGATFHADLQRMMDKIQEKCEEFEISLNTKNHSNEN